MNPNNRWLTQQDGLAETLRRVRVAAGLTGVQLAASLDWAQSKVSKLETGKQLPTSHDIEAWVGACGETPDVAKALLEQLAELPASHRSWRRRIGSGQVAIQRSYADLAEQALVIRNCEVTYVPGLLQTPTYAAYRLRESVSLHGADEAEVTAAVNERMRRQQILYDPTRRFEFILTESTLRLLLCPAPAMAAQLDRLLNVIGLPQLRLGVIPFGVQLTTAPQNGFILFDDTAVVETFVGETIHHGEEAAAYAAAMDRLAAQARYDEDCRQLILGASDDLRRAVATADPPSP